MPGFYAKGDYDLVGTILGVVDRKTLLDGSKVRIGDRVIGLASTGLHTNGYTLAREVLFERLKLKISSRPKEMGGMSIGKALLAVHRNYHPLLARLRLKKIPLHAAAHITGGGFEENIPRSLPRHCDVLIVRSAWKVPPIFSLIQKGGRISDTEMHRVFNMGIGMTLLAPSSAVSAILHEARKFRIPAMEIGRVVRGRSKVHLD